MSYQQQGLHVDLGGNPEVFPAPAAATIPFAPDFGAAISNQLLQTGALLRGLAGERAARRAPGRRAPDRGAPDVC